MFGVSVGESSRVGSAEIVVSLVVGTVIGSSPPSVLQAARSAMTAVVISSAVSLEGHDGKEQPP